MNFIFELSKEILFFINEISIYLIFGFFVAGVLHIIFPESIIRRHLGRNSFGSVIKSTLFGIPLPLCSCGVVPVAASLKNSGASKGASISFLIATPQIGADSFLITYSLLGWVFGIFRILASLITAMVAGIMVNFISRNDGPHAGGLLPDYTPSETFKDRFKSFFSYLEYELLGSIANTLVVGMLVAGLIAAIIPDGFFERYFDYPFLSMLVMLVVGIPMYVCAAASTPIAASLILKGLSPGAGLVFLLTGPATNAVTISTVVASLGKRAAVIYIASISIVGLILGYLLNIVIAKYGFHKIIMTHQHEMLPGWLKLSGAVALVLMLGWYYFKTKVLIKFERREEMGDNKISINVEGMTCMHCAGSVKKAVESVDGTSDVVVDLDGKNVKFAAGEDTDMTKIKAAITSAGYNVARE
ncbi:MAG: hypothetical protein GY864_08100 [Desulfobacterales bacterium]|nr:hypothetical protein [Desulfobacterales bacterium]